MTTTATDFPQIIFFDAGGTLLEVRGSVGEIYSRVARDYGLMAEPEQLQQGFLGCFRAQPPLAFPPGLPAVELQAHERAWWERLVREVFAEYEPFPRFAEFFAAVFDVFRQPECWRLYDDVWPALTALQECGVRLAVLSNFDSRLDEILQLLGLAQFFDAVHISTRLGAAKPDPLIFRAALQQQGIEAQAAWHVGDAWREDVKGALAAGVQPVWLERSGALNNDERVTRISRLTELADLLSQQKYSGYLAILRRTADAKNTMTKQKKTPQELRSHRWFGQDNLRSFSHRSRAKQMGYGQQDFAGKPVIAVINTWSDLTTCHSHFRDRAEEVKRGVWQAGGFPVEIPALPVNETFMKPSPLMYRNLLALEVEELLRCQPLDGAVLLGGCDKTTPGLLMGALSMNVPTIYLPAGPMLRGNWNGQVLGSGSDVWKYWAEKRAGNIGDCEWNEIEDGIARSAGHCMTMGTASTMTALAETLGMTLPGASSIPAVDANHARMATACGRRIVGMVWEDLKPRDILTMQAFENAIAADMAIGGSTNAIIHLTAMAGRAGIKLELQKFDEIAQRTPMIANIRPSGKFLMEDFYYAGGLRALLAQMRELLHLDCLTVAGTTLGENIAGAQVHNADVIRVLDNPVAPLGGTAILYGNLAPDGAVIKPTAAEERLWRHTGRAVVFRDYNDLHARIDDENLDVDENSIIVLQNAGPLGGPGMPEWGMLPIPKKLLKQGVRDMVRISDARMSGTSYGACVLHVAPESFIGGPLALVRDGDLIELDVPARKLQLLVSEAELAERRAAWVKPARRYERGFGALFAEHVTQADQGCDFTFLHAGAETPEPEIH